MPVIKNINDFQNILEKRLQDAMIMTRDHIFEVVSKAVVNYYCEPVFNNDPPNEPSMYSRTYNLMESFTATNINKTVNGFECRIGWDDDYLSFNYKKLTGLEVLKSFNSSAHGFTVKGQHNYWDEAMYELGGENGIKQLFIDNCIKCGLPIK